MSSRAYVRGHEVYYDFKNETYRYSDDDTEVFMVVSGKVSDERDCPYCELPPGDEQCDACLGLLPGVKAACCGHGDRKSSYVIFNDERELSMSRAEQQRKLVKAWNLAHEVVIPVSVEKDDGSTFETVTRSHADLLGAHTAVIWLEGVASCYLLTRVTPI